MKNKITDEVLLEELKRRFNENKKALLEVQNLAYELKEVNKKLTESEALKSHFISNITNEIINPFTSIIILSKNILSIREGDWGQVKKMARMIHSEAFNLDFQLKNIFTAAEIEAGELFLEPVKIEINQLIQTVIESYQPEAEKKKITIKYVNKTHFAENDLYFNTDSEKLRLIFANIIDNSIKYSSPNNKVTITVNLKDNILTASVQDYGIGISDKNRRIIFDRFKRIDSGINSLNRGHGLGLSINKALLDLMGGQIEINSKKNVGTLFIIKVPELNEESSDFSTGANDLFFGNDEIF